jgi:hypothetical protein
MECPITLSIAQINFHPAYFSGGKNLIIEPFGNETTSISKIRFEGYDKLKLNLHHRYLNWLRAKLTIIISTSINNESDILVLPEYSVPFELLEEIFEQIKGTDLTVVAGSHMVTSNSLDIYSRLKIDINDEHIRCAICPVLHSTGNSYIFKNSKSSYEGSLLSPKSESFNWITKYKNGMEINLGIFLCIDGLKKPFHDTVKEHALIIVPSWSPTTEPFEGIALNALYNELPLAYVNTSLIGESRVFVPFPETDRHWFAEKNSTKEIPKNTEGLMTVTIDMNNIRRNRGTVREHLSAELIDVKNFVYSLTIQGEDLVNGIGELERTYNRVTAVDLMSKTNDELLRQKLNEMDNLNQSGILIPSAMKSLCSYLLVEEISYNDLMQEQADTIIQFITSHPESLKDQDVMFNLSVVTTNASQIMEKNTNQLVHHSIEEKPFFDRETELGRIRQFFGAPSESLLMIQGMRGIGKSTLIDQIHKKILPPKNLWKQIIIRFNSGTGFPLFIDNLAYQLGSPIRFETRHEDDILDITRSLLEVFERFPAAYIIIDDFHHILDKEGSFVDSRFIIFMDEYLRRTILNHKLIILTNRFINYKEIRDSHPPITLRGIKDEAISSIIDFHYRSITGRHEGIQISEALLKNLHGNPLAAVITAQYLQHHSIKHLEESKEVFRRFQEQFIKKLLSELEFKPDEQEVLNFISSTKNEVSTKIIHMWKPGIDGIIESLCSLFILEYNHSRDTYSIHPLVHDYLYQKLDFDSRIMYHSSLADFNESILDEYSSKEENLPPQIIGELLFHYAGSLQRDKLLAYKINYFDELRPIADQLYNNKKYEKALEYYLLLLEMSRIKRDDVLEKVFMCYGNLGNWKEANQYFEETVGIKQKVSYYAKYSILLSTKTRRFEEAESVALLGEVIYSKKSNKKNWELAKIKHALGKVRERQGHDKCIEFYKEANELDQTNVFYKYQYAKVLLKWGYDAIDVIKQGLSIQGDHKELLLLKAGLSIDDSDDELDLSEEQESDE